MRSERKFTTHHICEKANGGTNDSDNKKRLRQAEHQGLHNFFQDRHGFCEKVKKLLELEDTALQGDLKRDFGYLADIYNGKEYHNTCKKNA